MEALIEKYEPADDALRRMARTIRAADPPHEEPALAEAAGVLAIFDGIRDASRSDEERLQRGLAVCDALYCRAWLACAWALSLILGRMILVR